MKFQFEANQQFQLEAMGAITDLFDGQPQGGLDFSPINLGQYGDLFEGQERTELGVGNLLRIGEEDLRDGDVDSRRVPRRRDELHVLVGVVYWNGGASALVDVRKARLQR